MTSNGSTLVECPPKNEELLLSEIYKHPPCVPYKRGRCLKIQVRAKPSKRQLHVDRSCVGLSPHCYHCSLDLRTKADCKRGDSCTKTRAKTRSDVVISSHQFPGRHMPLQKSSGGAILVSLQQSRKIPHSCTQAHQLERHRKQKRNSLLAQIP